MSLSKDQRDAYVSLLKAFLDAAHALNTQDKAAVDKLLHEDVVLNKIYNPVATERTKKGVLDYLVKKFATERLQLTPISPISIDTRSGTVSGVAMWEDGSGTINVDYSFGFIWTDKDGWRIHNMQATPRRA